MKTQCKETAEATERWMSFFTLAKYWWRKGFFVKRMFLSAALAILTMRYAEAAPLLDFAADKDVQLSGTTVTSWGDQSASRANAVTKASPGPTLSSVTVNGKTVPAFGSTGTTTSRLPCTFPRPEPCSWCFEAEVPTIQTDD